VAILIVVLIAFLIAAVCIYLVDMVGLPAPINMIVKLVIVVLAIAFIAQRAGVF